MHAKIRVLMIFSVFGAMALQGGCFSQDTEELENFRTADAEFRHLVDTKGQMLGQIDRWKGELRDRKTDLDRQTKQLRKGFEGELSSKSTKIDDLKEKIRNAKSRYTEDTVKLKDKLSVRREETEELREAIEHVHDVLSNRDALSVSGEELKQWQKRLLELEAKAESHAREMADIESEIALRKKKLKYL